MIAAILFAAFVIFCVWSVIAEVRSERKKIAAQDKRRDEFLETEKKKPRFVVAFLTGLENKYSKPEEPTAVYFWRDYSLQTSEMEAKRLLNAFYERTFFTDKDGITYPACNIVKAWVEQEKK